jgi:HSP20 family protein
MAAKPGRNSKRKTPDTGMTRGSDLLLEQGELLNPFALGAWTPPVDICQTAGRVVVRIELPGVAPSDVSLSYRAQALRIRGIKREKPHKLLCYYCLERRYGTFDRRIPIEGVVNPRQGRAHLQEGILTVELPKLEERRGAGFEIQIDAK